VMKCPVSVFARRGGAVKKKTVRKQLFRKASVRCTAVSGDRLSRPANEFASRESLSPDSPHGPVFTEKQKPQKTFSSVFKGALRAELKIGGRRESQILQIKIIFL